LAERCPGISHGNSGWDDSREFAREMMLRYGTCAFLAWDGPRVVGHLRFYPMKVARLIADSQTDPSPLLDCTAACDPDDDDGTLWVQCVMTSAPYRSSREVRKVGARRGVGLQLVRGLIEWARGSGWKRIIKVAHCDLDWFYGVQGGGGRAFWEKAGFKVGGTFYIRAWEFSPDAWTIVQAQMTEKGLTEKDIWTWYRMVYEISS
jgi:GNAT superfamily N-acetyltransferase